MKTSKTWLMGASLVLPLFGCPGDDGTTDDGGNDTTTSGETGSGSGSASGTDTNPSTTDPPTTSADSDSGGSEDSSGDPPMDCLGIGGPGADGEMCTANGDCMSGVCTIFTDVPINADAVCEPHPADCSTRVTGTIFDFTTFEPVGGADLVVAAALQAATNPTGAMALVSATSAADGRVDSVSDGPISAPLGIVGLSSAPSYFLTATGIASPFDDVSAYAVGTNIHDIWVVPEGDLSDWSDALSADPMVPAAGHGGRGRGPGPRLEQRTGGGGHGGRSGRRSDRALPARRRQLQ